MGSVFETSNLSTLSFRFGTLSLRALEHCISSKLLLLLKVALVFPLRAVLTSRPDIKRTLRCAVPRKDDVLIEVLLLGAGSPVLETSLSSWSVEGKRLLVLHSLPQ